MTPSVGGGGGGERAGDSARASPISVSVEPVLSEVSAGAVAEEGPKPRGPKHPWDGQQGVVEKKDKSGWEQQGGKTLALNGGTGGGDGGGADGGGADEKQPSIGSSLRGDFSEPKAV